MHRPARRLAALLVLVALAALAPPADAARFGRCSSSEFADLLGGRCATLRVPLDPSGGTPGTVPLRVTQFGARSRPRRTFVALAGGPGQAAIPFALDFALTLAPSLRRDRFVVFDQRGTGRSGVLRCPELERAEDIFTSAEPAERCAERLGERRAFYTTRESAADIEAVRRAVRADRLVLYGVSYGTKVAVEYARRHPDRVERMVLDSPLEPEGPDPFYRDTLSASARVLRGLCARRRCRHVTGDAIADLRELVGRVAAAPIDGVAYDARGRARRQPIRGWELLAVLLAGDFDTTMREAFPAAVRAALAGDPALLARLVRRATAVENEVGSVRLFSPGLYAATVCEEAPLPWARDAPFEDRRRQAEQAAAALPPDAFRPFDVATALGSDFLITCSRWRAASRPPDPVGELPAVPALIVAGERDLRTPVEGGERLARRIPGAALVRVTGAGHSVLGALDFSCTELALDRFLAGRRVGSRRCRRSVPALEIAPVPPASLDAVPPAPGVRGRRGRTLGATVLTLRDVFTELDALVLAGILDEDRLAGGGLRGGRFAITRRGSLSLRSVELVPGVRVSGVISVETLDGRLRITGPAAARGRLTLRGGRAISGRLDGRSVRGRLRGFFRLARPRRATARAALAGPHAGALRRPRGGRFATR